MLTITHSHNSHMQCLLDGRVSMPNGCFLYVQFGVVRHWSIVVLVFARCVCIVWLCSLLCAAVAVADAIVITIMVVPD